MSATQIELLYTDGCANAGATGALVQEVVDALVPGAVVQRVLCAEEVCPAWLGKAHRVHWGLPDPAAVEGDGRLDAFRATRDEIRRWLEAVFARGR